MTQTATQVHTVIVVSWSRAGALARVDGVRVRVRRYRSAVRRLCAACGTQLNFPRCPHAVALARTSADPALFIDGPTYGDRRPPTSTTNKK